PHCGLVFLACQQTASDGGTSLGRVRRLRASANHLGQVPSGADPLSLSVGTRAVPIWVDTGSQAQNTTEASGPGGGRIPFHSIGNSEFGGGDQRPSDLEALPIVCCANGDAHLARRRLLRAVLRQRLATNRGPAEWPALLCTRAITTVCRGNTRAHESAWAHTRTVAQEVS